MYPYAPPSLPPKPPGSQEAYMNRLSAPETTSRALSPSSRHRPLPQPPLPEVVTAAATLPSLSLFLSESIPDPGDQWLPKFLQHKSWVAWFAVTVHLVVIGLTSSSALTQQAGPG